MKKVDNLLYRRLMDQYFRYHEWNYATSITYVKTFREKNELIIEIETHYPGILIGKGGRFIDGLKTYIEEEIKESIKLVLKECTLWRKLYT